MGARVETPLGSFRLDSTTQREGPVVLTIRPENLRLYDTSPVPTENTVPGVITHATYAGTHTRFKVCVTPGSHGTFPAAGGIRINNTNVYHFDVIAEASAGERFKVNHTIHLHFPADRLWLLPPDSSHAS